MIKEWSPVSGRATAVLEASPILHSACCNAVASKPPPVGASPYLR